MLTRVRGWVSRRLFRAARWLSCPVVETDQFVKCPWVPKRPLASIADDQRAEIDAALRRAVLDGGAWVELPARDVTVTDKGCAYLNPPDSLTITCDAPPGSVIHHLPVMSDDGRAVFVDAAVAG